LHLSSNVTIHLHLIIILSVLSILRISALIGHVSLPYIITLSTHILTNFPFILSKKPLVVHITPSLLKLIVTRFDEVIRNTLASLGNLKLDAEAWAQASLPVRFGGIGVRRVEDLAPSAFLSSMLVSASMIQTLLPGRAKQAPDPALDMALSHWMARGGTSAPTGADSLVQRVWDEGVCAAKAA